MTVLATVITTISQDHAMEHWTLIEEMLTPGKASCLFTDIDFSGDEVFLGEVSIELIPWFDVALKKSPEIIDRQKGEITQVICDHDFFVNDPMTEGHCEGRVHSVEFDD
tara:strand:- start:141 stop:467 length:327 start_codon:yes stop_codon:yes gene_type:complete